MTGKALILLSGGQDSFICLHWARRQFAEIEAVSFAYGQRHVTELGYARRLAQSLSVRHHTLEIGSLIAQLGPSALLGDGDLHGKHPGNGQLPASFVPGRNGLFLSLASAFWYGRTPGPLDLVIGACEADYSGYPDCRDPFIKAKALELGLGLDRTVNIHAPLMWLRKADTFRMAKEWGVLDRLVEDTLTCYEGEERLHPWGRGCGQCPACGLRARGFAEAFGA